MDKAIFRAHPVLKMGLCVLATALSFPCWSPVRLGLVCLLLTALQLAEGASGVGKNLLAAMVTGGVMSAISYTFARELSGALCAGLHFSVLLLAAYYMFQTSPSELLRGLQSCRIPDQLLLGFLVMYRFVDVLREELKAIYQAGTMVDTRRIGFFRKCYRCLMIPFCFRMFTLSDQLSLSIMSRDFGCGARTQYRENKISAPNALFAAAVGALCVVIVWLPLK